MWVNGIGTLGFDRNMVGVAGFTGFQVGVGLGKLHLGMSTRLRELDEEQVFRNRSRESFSQLFG